MVCMTGLLWRVRGGAGRGSSDGKAEEAFTSADFFLVNLQIPFQRGNGEEWGRTSGP